MRHSTLKLILVLIVSAASANCFAIIPGRYLGQPQAPNLAISSFSKVISSNRLVGRELAERLIERGRLYSELFRFQDAVADFSRALKVEPNFVEAYVYRATAYARLEQYPNAYDDFTVALKLDPGNLSARLRRGLLYFLHGKYAEATTDFEQYLKYRPGDLYRVLWIYLSERYQKLNFTTVRQHLRGVNMKQWPGALVQLYLGEVDIQDLIKALKPQLSGWSASSRCEAYYYLAQYHLLKGERKEAVAYFQQALKTKATKQLEYEFSIVYLRKLNVEIQ